MALVDTSATAETQELYLQLQNAQGNYVYWGYHQPFLANTQTAVNGVYGVPDSFRIAGLYPYVYGTDYKNSGESYDKVSGNEEYLKRHYRNGGFIQMSWHMTNWVTLGNLRDTTGDPVTNVLPGGTARATYLTELDEFANFCNNFKDDRGNLIPIIFRPYHEADGNWFWWGTSTCSDAEYVFLWQDLITYLKDIKNVHNLIYCYAPEWQYGGSASELRYAGDDYVDIIGIDQYKDTAQLAMPYFQIGSDFAILHNKLFAICEGMENVNTDALENYWTESFSIPILSDSKASKVSYMMVWKTYNWGPMFNRVSKTSFLEMSQNPKIRMLGYEDTITDENNIGINFYVNDDDNNFEVYHNTFIGNGVDEGIHLDTGFATKTAIFKNNIIETQGTAAINVPTGTTLDYNCYYDTTGNYQFTYGGITYTDFATYQAATGQDSHSIAADPLLTADYKLKTGSPCIDKGVDVGVNTDYEGNNRPNGRVVDIGAYEYQHPKYDLRKCRNDPIGEGSPWQ